MTKKLNAKAAFIGNPASAAPGGYLESPELDRANTFARMASDLEPALVDRVATIAIVRDAVSTYEAQFESHRRDLLIAAQGVEDGTRKPRELEATIDDKLTFYRSAEQFTLSTAARRPDATQIHAAAQAERFRVANNPNFWRNL